MRLTNYDELVAFIEEGDHSDDEILEAAQQHTHLWRTCEGCKEFYETEDEYFMWVLFEDLKVEMSEITLKYIWENFGETFLQEDSNIFSYLHGCRNEMALTKQASNEMFEYACNVELELEYRFADPDIYEQSDYVDTLRKVAAHPLCTDKLLSSAARGIHLSEKFDCVGDFEECENCQELLSEAIDPKN